MENVSQKQLRKELWDYLKEQGIEITMDQHKAIKDILENYAEVRAGVLRSEITQLQKTHEQRNAERRAKKAAKLAARGTGVTGTQIQK